VLATGLGAGLGWAIGGVGSHQVQRSAAFWGGVIGFGLVGVFLYWLCAYILYLVEVGHTAVLAALLDGKTLPAGRSTVAKRIYLFPSAGVLSLPALPAASRAVTLVGRRKLQPDSCTLDIGIQIAPGRELGPQRRRRRRAERSVTCGAVDVEVGT